jgi:hypothetical protein
MSNGQQGQQSTLQNVYSYSFTANNLFQISLVKDMDPNRPGYKRQFFCFLTLAPGEQAQGGGRTYNFSNKINMKQDVHNVMALAHALRAVARGQKALIGNFSLFTDSSKSSHGQGGGAVKQVFVNEYIKQQQNQQGPSGTGERFVSLGFRFGQNKPIGLMFSIPDALACADILEHIGKMGLRLDASGAAVSFAAKPPPGQTNAAPPTQNYPTGGGYNQPQTAPNVNTTETVLNNFQEGLNNASNPASPPSMNEYGDNDIPF